MSASTQASLTKPEAKTEKAWNSSSQAEKLGPSPLVNSPVEQISFLQRTVGNRGVERLLRSRVIQAKLAIDLAGLAKSLLPLLSCHGATLQRKCSCGGELASSEECEECSNNRRLALRSRIKIAESEDKYEREADRTADQVMVTPPAHSAVRAAAASIQRRSAESNGPIAALPTNVRQVLAGSGSPLELSIRRQMEHRFNHDFARVRVHTGARAADSARTVNALAYTVRNNIVFGAGHYPPTTRKERWLLAHELAHVIQQEAGNSQPGRPVLSKKDDDKPQSPPPKSSSCVPTFKALTAAITGTVGVRDVNGRCALILGTPGKANGATFTSKVEVPAACTGTLQYVQLINMCRSFHTFSGKDLRRNTGGDWIDTKDPVDEQHVPSSGTVEFSTNDSPHQPVAPSVERVKAVDSFKMWLMWKPDQPPNANRVPLAKATWNWSGEAKVKNDSETECTKRWVIISENKNGGKGKVTKDSPAATKTVTSSDPPIEEGKKC
jgi:uncharacterized protein DUF4157